MGVGKQLRSLLKKNQCLGFGFGFGLDTRLVPTSVFWLCCGLLVPTAFVGKSPQGFVRLAGPTSVFVAAVPYLVPTSVFVLFAPVWPPPGGSPAPGVSFAAQLFCVSWSPPVSKLYISHCTLLATGIDGPGRLHPTLPVQACRPFFNLNL